MTLHEMRRRMREAVDPALAERRRQQNAHPDRRGPRPGHPGGKYHPEEYVIAPLDGEGFEFALPSPVTGPLGETRTTESRYCLLQVRGLRPLWAEEGLGTERILRYLCTAPATWALVGFGLHYDMECWLRDVPDDLYRQMVDDGEQITWGPWRLQYIPRKLLMIQTTAGQIMRHAEKPTARIERVVMDAWGYYQASLIGALVKSHIAVPPEITAGKAARGGFRWPDRAAVQAYNASELEAMHALFSLSKKEIEEGLAEAGHPIRIGKRDWYGPGALARQFLTRTRWREEHPLLDWSAEARAALTDHPYASAWDAPWVRRFPFSAAYTGGRIEQAATGRWAAAWDSDLHNAYPMAMTRLPRYASGDGLYLGSSAEATDAARRRIVGMYLVEWEFPPGWDWYPLPYRGPTGNVFYPQIGCGWIMSTEVCAVLDTIGADHLRILRAMVLDGTDGYGGGDVEVTGPRRSTAASAFVAAAAVRQRLVREGKGSEKGIKLAKNSSYGILWRQVGIDPDKDVKFFGDLAGAWITSWTRAMVWRRLWGHHADHTVTAIQTDGLAHLVPLDGAGEEGPGMGQWETETLADYRQLLPGIYDHAQPDGSRKTKRRGFTAAFDADAAWDVIRGASPAYAYDYRFFVGRRHALAQHDVYGPWRYQWVIGRKVFSPSLRSKRVQGEFWAEGVRRQERELPRWERYVRDQARAGWRYWLSEVRRVTEGQMIRPDHWTEIPPSMRRHRSRFGLDLTAELLQTTETDLLHALEGAWRRSRLSDAEVRAEAARLQDAEPAPTTQGEGPWWTAPKPAPTWTALGQASHPFPLAFGALPHVPGEDWAEQARIEDAGDSDYVAGIRP